MTTTSQKGFKIGPPMPDIEGGSKIPQALNNPVSLPHFALFSGGEETEGKQRKEFHFCFFQTPPTSGSHAVAQVYSW